MSIAAIVGAGIAAAAAAAVLRRTNGEFALFVSLAACLVILYAVITSVQPLIALVKDLSDEAGTEAAYIAILMKALAVCVITRLASECCRDSGEGAIASKIEFAGKTAILLVSVPLFRAVLDIVKGLMI